jgi:hypothetical protein
MLINVTSTDQTIDIFISDGELQSVIVGDWGIGSPKRVGGREMASRNILQLLWSPIQYFMHFRHVL